MTTENLIEKQIDHNIPIWENCPRFSSCNVNRCPLHPDYKKLKSSPNDKNRKCLLGKTRKRRILKYYSIEKQSYDERTKEKNVNGSNSHINQEVQR